MFPQPNNQESFVGDAANSGTVPQPAASNGNVPHAAAQYGTAPQPAAEFGNVRRSAERKQSHTLTVKQVARMFEEAGVSRIERTIVNWCQPNKHGVARLDAYFDPNEHRYLITAESVDRAIQEEQAKGTSAPVEHTTELPHDSASHRTEFPEESDQAERIKELERENLDLKIANRGKDYFVEQLQKDRESFIAERRDYVEKLMSFNHRVGELQTQLLQLEGTANVPRTIRVISQGTQSDSEKIQKLS